jgi:hypothetical protein
MIDDDIALLESDIARTVGVAEAPRVRRRAAEIIAFGLPLELEKLVDDVQQEILDLHIRTVWPACPAHPQHPLWFSEGAWRCRVQSTIAVALGSLASTPTNPPRAQ